MITNVTSTQNYNYYNTNFKGWKDGIKKYKDKFKNIILDKTPKVTKEEIKEKQMANIIPLRQSLIMQLLYQPAILPHTPLNNMIARERSNLLTFLQLPDRLRGMLKNLGVGEKFEELNNKLALANNEEEKAIKQEMRALLDECAEKNPKFAELLNSLKRMMKDGQEIHAGTLEHPVKFKGDVLNLFTWK